MYLFTKSNFKTETRNDTVIQGDAINKRFSKAMYLFTKSNFKTETRNDTVIQGDAINKVFSIPSRTGWKLGASQRKAIFHVKTKHD
ncbi:unnamed protein product [Fasciola hepatica]|uniref:Uncharacterized protein n=1 Tax=Fasciola hepatica TaxID=6192 RepID=A0ABC9HIH8_FASHE